MAIARRSSSDRNGSGEARAGTRPPGARRRRPPRSGARGSAPARPPARGRAGCARPGAPRSSASMSCSRLRIEARRGPAAARSPQLGERRTAPCERARLLQLGPRRARARCARRGRRTAARSGARSSPSSRRVRPPRRAPAGRAPRAASGRSPSSARASRGGRAAPSLAHLGLEAVGERRLVEQAGRAQVGEQVGRRCRLGRGAAHQREQRRGRAPCGASGSVRSIEYGMP